MQDYTTTGVPSFSVFDDPSYDEIEAVSSMMREEDMLECAAWGLTPRDAAAKMMHCEYKWVVYQGPYPVFAFGLRRHMQDAYYLCGFGASDMDECTLRALTRWGLKEWLPNVFYVLNARRVDAIVPALSHHSIKWLLRCGMSVIGSEKDFVRRGDRFVRLAYTISDYEDEDDHVHIPGRASTAGAADRPGEVECANSDGDGAAPAVY